MHPCDLFAEDERLKSALSGCRQWTPEREFQQKRFYELKTAFKWMRRQGKPERVFQQI